MVSLLTELAVLLVLRTRRPAWRSRPASLLWASAAAVALLALCCPMPAPARLFDLVPLAGRLAGRLLGIVLAYSAATEFVKHRFYARTIVRRRAPRRRHRP